MAQVRQRYPGETNEAHPEPFVKIPPQPKEKKPGQLTDEQVKKFFDEGFLIIEKYFDTDTELEPVKKYINDLVDSLANKLHKAGKISSTYQDCGFLDRLSQIENEFPGANIILHKSISTAAPIRALWSNPRLLNIMEQLLGTKDIIGHPVWNLRTKTPQNEATTVPWHQDVAYLDPDAYQVLQPAAWIPLLDTNKENGCMEVVRGGHRTGRIARHEGCYGDTWYVMLTEEEIEKTLDVCIEKDKVLCEIPYGGMLLLNNLIPHRSLNNLSDKIRWSLDLRWQRANQPVGFHGLKQGVVMRTSTDDKPDIDWDGFNRVDRHIEAHKEGTKQEEMDPFDTIIVGPWMKSWEIVHHNRHTAMFKDLSGSYCLTP